MRVVHVIQRYEPALGGAEVWCRDLARQQAADGDQVRVLTLDIVREHEFWRQPGDSEQGFRLGHLDLDGGVEIRRFHRTLPVWTLHHLVLDRLLGRLLDIFWLGPHSAEMAGGIDAELADVDLVHLHALPYPHIGLGLAAARRAGKAVVITPHFHEGHRDYERPHQIRRLRRADRVIVLTNRERDVLLARGVAPERLTVAGCALPAAVRRVGRPDADDEPDDVDRGRCRRALESRLGLEPSSRRIVCLARRFREKGIDTLVQAFGRLVGQERDVALVLAGPDQDWWPSFLATQPAAVRARIFDAGILREDEKADVLAGCDVFAMPSRWEAFGMVFLEAWAAGLPVVGGNAGAQREVIGNGGVVTDPDDVEAVARAIEVFLDDAEAAARAVRAGRVRLREHDTREIWSRTIRNAYRQAQAVTPGRRSR